MWIETGFYTCLFSRSLKDDSCVCGRENLVFTDGPATEKNKSLSIMNNKFSLWSSWKEFKQKQPFACSDAHSCSAKVQSLNHHMRYQNTSIQATSHSWSHSWSLQMTEMTGARVNHSFNTVSMLNCNTLFLHRPRTMCISWHIPLKATWYTFTLFRIFS